MGRTTKPRIFGTVGVILSSLWSGYANWTTVSQLPSDAGWVAKMLADPPVYLPWLCLAFFVVVAAWAFWPKDEGPPAQPSGGHVTHGPNSPVINSVAGNVTQHIYPAPPVQERMSGYSLESLESLGRIMRGETTPEPTSPWDDPSFSLLNQGKHEVRHELLPDMPLREVLDLLYTSLGGPPQLISEFEDRVDLAIRDAVHHRKLHTWGRKEAKGTLVPVWDSAWIRGDFSHKRGTVRFRDPDNSRALHEWRDLHFNRREVDKWQGPKYDMVVI